MSWRSRNPGFVTRPATLSGFCKLAAGEVLGTLEDNRDSFGAATLAVGDTIGVLPLPQGGEAAAEDSVAARRKSPDLLTEQLRGVKALARALAMEKLRTDDEPDNDVAQLCQAQRRLRDKTISGLFGAFSVPLGIATPCIIWRRHGEYIQ